MDSEISDFDCQSQFIMLGWDETLAMDDFEVVPDPQIAMGQWTTWIVGHFE